MKQLMYLMALIPCLLFSHQTKCCEPCICDRDNDELLTKRNKLEIQNNTHLDESGLNTDDHGRYLNLTWNRDVHQPPQYTENLTFGQTDSRKSRGIGNGDNYRHFDIEVFREFFGDVKRVGNFTHSIFAGPFSNGETEKVYIRKNFTADKVQLWALHYEGTEGGIEEKWDYIGSLPRDQW